MSDFQKRGTTGGHFVERQDVAAPAPQRKLGQPMMYGFDFEFLECGPSEPLRMISLGVSAEDGRKFYRQDVRFNFGHGEYQNPWLVDNVYPHLWHFGRIDADDRFRLRYPAAEPLLIWHRICAVGSGFLAGSFECDDKPCPWATREQIAQELIDFCDPEKYGEPEFWGYYADYDWVLLSQLFGRMIDLPKGWPKFAYDVRQMLNDRGLKDVRQPDEALHFAGSDADWALETVMTYR